MSHKYSIEEKVENYFASLQARYRPFQMHQFCNNCGKDLHRNQFQMLVAGYTNPVCKWCTSAWRKTGRWPHPRPAPQWESREMMRQRLLKEFGTVEYTRLGVTHRGEYKLSKRHREAIRNGVLKHRAEKK